MKRFETILHPTDFSPGAAPAFRYACELAGDYDARLVVVYVLEPGLPMVGEGGLVPTDLPEIRAAAEREFDALQPTVPGVRLGKLIREGSAPATILAAAREVRADLIVMGTHGRTGLGRLLLGSVAEEVVRKAPCPVLTVKTDAPPSGPELRTELAAGGVS
jgi:nucleotide-binding universal stress UspA family protein